MYIINVRKNYVYISPCERVDEEILTCTPKAVLRFTRTVALHLICSIKTFFLPSTSGKETNYRKCN